MSSFDMDRIKISTSPFTNTIWIGRVNKAETLYLDKRDATDEALCAVRDYLVGQIDQDGPFHSFGYEWTRRDGSIVELRATIKEATP